MGGLPHSEQKQRRSELRGMGKLKGKKEGKLRLGCKTNIFFKVKKKSKESNRSAVGTYLYLQRKGVVVYKSSSIQLLHCAASMKKVILLN